MPQVAGHVILGKEFAGFVAEASDGTSSVGTTTTEVVSTSITFTAFAGVRYKVTYVGNCESTVTVDGLTLRLRWKNSGVADTTGTIFAKAGTTEDVGGFGHAFTLVGTFNTQTAGALTVVATILRAAGSGTVRQNGTSNNGQLYFLVEII